MSNHGNENPYNNFLISEVTVRISFDCSGIRHVIKNSKKELSKYKSSSTRCDLHMSLVMRKLDFRTCENKDAEQLRGNREADQRLCFCYIDSTIPLLS